MSAMRPFRCPGAMQQIANTALLLVILPLPGMALEALSDRALSNVTGRDGLTLKVGGESPMTAGQIKWITDDNGLDDFTCTGGTTDRHACTIIDNVQVGGLNGAGTWSARLDIDTATDSQGYGMFALSGSWTPQRLVLGGLSLDTPTVDASMRSLGALAIQSQGSFSYANRGLLYNSEDTARLAFSAYGDIIYRQGAAGNAEVSFADFLLDFGFTNGAGGGQLSSEGRVGLDGSGIFMSAPFARTDIGFDLAYKAAPTDFDTAGRTSMISFDWSGGLVDPVWRIGAGGFGYETYTSGLDTFQDYDGAQTGIRSQGFNLRAEWNFDSDFKLAIGEASGNGTYASVGNWKRLGASSGKMFSFPVIFDIFQNGAGPQGLCLGAFFSGVPDQGSCNASAGGEWIASDPPGAGEAAFGALIRDARLLAYGTNTQVIDPVAGGSTPTNWALAFTYGKLDADIFIYPEGRADGVLPASTDVGLKADITLAAQSPDAWRRANSSTVTTRSTSGDGWRNNTHFLMVDTDSGIGSGELGIGIANGDIVYRARDLYLRVTDGDSGYSELPGGLWLHTDTKAEYRFRGIFGGGDMADLSYGALTKVSLVDVNLSTNRFIFVLSPRPVGSGGEAPIGFDGLLDFDGAAYMSFGEISSPESTFYVNQVGGRVGWRDGSLSLVSGVNTGDGLPQISLTNDLLLGESANFGDAGGRPLVGTVGFGSEDFARIAFPGGSWSSEVIVKIPN